MKPQGLQQSRNIVTSVLTVIGVGLFALISFKAINQISDRQYVEGKQKQSPTLTVAEAQNSLDSTIKTTSGISQLSNPYPTHPAAITTASATASSTSADDKPATPNNDNQQPHNRNETKKGKEFKHHED